MTNPRATLRAWWRPAAIAAAIIAAVAACTPPTPGGGSPEEPWLEAGCYGSDVPDIRDFTYDGALNTVGNTTIWLSTDSTCTGSPLATLTLVQAADQDAADTLCTSIGLGGPAIQLSADPREYEVPADAWGCAPPAP